MLRLSEGMAGRDKVVLPPCPQCGGPTEIFLSGLVKRLAVCRKCFTAVALPPRAPSR